MSWEQGQIKGRTLVSGWPLCRQSAELDRTLVWSSLVLLMKSVWWVPPCCVFKSWISRAAAGLLVEESINIQTGVRGKGGLVGWLCHSKVCTETEACSAVWVGLYFRPNLPQMLPFLLPLCFPDVALLHRRAKLSPHSCSGRREWT